MKVPRIIRIRPLLDLRKSHGDQTLLDYLTLWSMAPSPSRIEVSELRNRWHCSQPQVSRRINAVAAAGLVDLTPGWGGYQVHGVEEVG